MVCSKLGKSNPEPSIISRDPNGFNLFHQMVPNQEIIYEYFIFSNEKELLDMGLSHSNDRINDFVLAEKTETYSGTDNPIFSN